MTRRSAAPRGASYKADKTVSVGLVQAFRLVHTAVKRLPWSACWHYMRVFVLCVVLVGSLAAAYDLLDHPLHRVELARATAHVQPAQVEAVTRPFIGQSFIALDLQEVDRTLREALPWVQQTRIRRIWPDRLEIRVTERVPVARLASGQLLSDRGQVFPADTAPEGLPLLSGPSESAGELWQAYRHWSDILAEVGIEIAQIQLEDRGAWTLVTTQGWPIRLGHDDMDARLVRAKDVLKAGLLSRAKEIERIDARYERGVAVKWRTAAQTALKPLS